MDENVLHVCDPKTMETKWTFGTSDEVLVTPAIAPDGVAYVVTGHKLYAVVEDTGTFLAAHPRPQAPTERPDVGIVEKADEWVVINGVQVPKRR